MSLFSHTGTYTLLRDNGQRIIVFGTWREANETDNAGWEILWTENENGEEVELTSEETDRALTDMQPN